ncbi:MAG: M20/M25/M40 family metallo-hydrolase [Armatimonadetes bacterium]|nr:M20/M25/M40 family metallo-hydrolase [Armatimonadota bacterium]
MALLACAAACAWAQGDPAVIEKIIEEGKTRNQTRAHLEYLTEQIGARLTSSLALQRACDWTQSMFESFGLTAYQEKWGEWPVGFDRGRTHVGRMVSPYERNFEFTTRSWTPGTNGLKAGRAVIAPETAEEVRAHPGRYNGAWVLMPGLGRRPNAEVRAARAELWDAIKESRPLGQVSGSRNELVLTSGRYNVEWDDRPTDVAIIIRKSDYDAVVAEVEAGRTTMLEFDLNQRMRKGPIPIYNVIAEIRGTEKPDEVVIVSGHLDSWDGPGSVGACDNGTGTMVALEAARILMAAGAKPERTIRFIMWTGEEQGLHGSREYVKMHEDELSKISVVLVDDGGTNYSGGLQCIQSMVPMLQHAIDPLTEAFPDLPMTLRIRERMPRGGGSDHASFNRVGVPGFFWSETGVADYQYIHHTQHDKLTAAINRYLIQSSVAAAVTAYNLACADTMLPRQPQGDGN